MDTHATFIHCDLNTKNFHNLHNFIYSCIYMYTHWLPFIESWLWNSDPNNIFASPPFCSPLKSTDRLATLAPAWQISGHSWTVGTSGCRLSNDLLSALWQAEEQAPINLPLSGKETRTTRKYGRSPFNSHIWGTHQAESFPFRMNRVLWSHLFLIFYKDIDHKTLGV